MTLPINEHSFWTERLTAAVLRWQLHESIYVVPPERWQHIQTSHQVLLQQLLKPGMRLLDGGCGYGALLEVLPSGLSYCGLDFVPQFVELAQKLHPTEEFVIGDLRHLPFPDNHFDVAICRSVEGMVNVNLGEDSWRQMEQELLRVAPTLILLSYSEPEVAVFRGTPLATTENIRESFPKDSD